MEQGSTDFSVPAGVQGGFVGVLDAGSFKTSCLIAAVESGRAPRVAGIAQAPSRGIKSGVVIDLAAAEHSVLSAIAEAERMAGMRLSAITITVNCGMLSSRHISAATAIGGGRVRVEDIAKLRNAAEAYAAREDRRLVHLSDSGYELDGIPLDGWPVGRSGHRLTAGLHLVTAEPAKIRNLEHVVERCYLPVATVLPAPLASALAVTTAAERNAGVLVLDFGAGTTGIAAFTGGFFSLADVVPMGGLHITLDIAQALRAPLEEAERIKAVYGTLFSARSDVLEVIEVSPVADDGGYQQQLTKAALHAVVSARVAMNLEYVARRLAAARLSRESVRSIVLTGGTAELPGLVECVEKYFGLPAREGRPGRIPGLPPAFSKPAFSGLAGALGAAIESMAHPLAAHQGADRALGYLGRVGQWLRSGF